MQCQHDQLGLEADCLRFVASLEDCGQSNINYFTEDGQSS
jgi:hypothetical protein